MTEQELMTKKKLYESHVAFKTQDLQSFKGKLKDINKALQDKRESSQLSLF